MKQTIYNYISIFYILTCIFINIFAIKPLSFGTNTIICDGGTILSWLLFIISSLIVECYGFDKLKTIIKQTVICQLFIFLISILIINIPTTSDYLEQAEALKQVFNSNIRIFISSISAFSISGFIDGLITHKLKSNIDKDSNNKFYFRSLFSSLIGQLFDNYLFGFLAFLKIGLSDFEMYTKDIITSCLYTTGFEIALESIITFLILKKLINFINKRIN